MADLDFFKKVNDNLGHVVGDDILKLFASIISNNIRKDDWVARYGGDEFLICLHDADKDVAYEISERIRKNTQNNDETFKKYNLKLAASFGIYTIEEGEKDYLEAIKKADEKLYKAKKKRNWVEA
jgi:diguanylate cyclase (GGDEF)-like protein